MRLRCLCQRFEARFLSFQQERRDEWRKKPEFHAGAQRIGTRARRWLEERCWGARRSALGACARERGQTAAAGKRWVADCPSAIRHHPTLTAPQLKPAARVPKIDATVRTPRSTSRNRCPENIGAGDLKDCNGSRSVIHRSPLSGRCLSYSPSTAEIFTL